MKLPFVTRSYHERTLRETISRLYDEQIGFQAEAALRLTAAVEKAREDERGLLDPYIKELSAYAATKAGSPPWKWHISLTIDEQVALILRDPAIGQHSTFREKAAKSIAARFYFHILKVLVDGLGETKSWEKFR